jgi:hypothetical protein
MAGAATNAAIAPFAGAAQGAALGSIAGPGGAVLGAVVGGLAGTVGEISKLPQKIMEWSEALVDSKRNLAQFSPTLANAFAQADQRGVVRNMGSAGRTSGTISELSTKLQDVYDTIQPIRDRFTVAVGSILTPLLGAVNKIGGVVEGLLSAAESIPLIGDALVSIRKEMEESAKKDKAEAGAFIGFLDTVAGTPGPTFPAPAPPVIDGRGGIGRKPAAAAPEDPKKPKRTGPRRPWRH